MNIYNDENMRRSGNSSVPAVDNNNNKKTNVTFYTLITVIIIITFTVTVGIVLAVNRFSFST